MNTRKAELIKEGFDHWRADHPFWHFADFKDYTHAKETCPFLSGELTEKEKNILIYIWHALMEGQEYDAGNSILLATQTDLISDVSIEKLANYFSRESVCVNSKIGKIVFSALTRSIGLWSFTLGQKDVGQRLWKLGIEITRTMNYQKNDQIKKWRKVSVNYSVPIELTMLLDKLA